MTASALRLAGSLGPEMRHGKTEDGDKHAADAGELVDADGFAENDEGQQHGGDGCQER